MVRRRAALAALPAWLTGCATPTRPAADGAALRPDQGLLALQLESDYQGQLEFMTREKPTLGSTFAEHTGRSKGTLALLAGKRQFLVLPVELGDYRWSMIAMGGRYVGLDSTPISIRPGQITYVGQIQIYARGDRVYHVVSNQADLMHEYLQARYPGYSGSMAFVTAMAQIYRA